LRPLESERIAVAANANIAVRIRMAFSLTCR
jgi:hypothetical protein